ncbi:MAG: hypothetical protein K0R82_158 [Flavipsychrobacter sp.]|nr:hypothetical protein [Flavipsychrobacter sp.]
MFAYLQNKAVLPAHMKKFAILFILSFTCGIAGYAQGVGSSQMLMMSLSNVIEVSFGGNGTAFDGPVSMEFNDPGDYINGIESPKQDIRVRTNKSFNVNIKAKSGMFNYNGPQYPAPEMPVDNTLSMSVTDNGSGRTIAPGTGGNNNYFPISTETQNVIIGGGTKGNQNYSVKYKTKPGQSIPEGTYAVDLIYTASQE